MSEPSTARADRNLLFGILALQMDFVTRDQLVAGMHAWVLDKAKPLGQLLYDQGALAAHALALLEPLVAHHLQRHGNDPEKSLQAVSTARSVQAELQQIADPDVQASLTHVSAAGPPIDPHATAPPPSVGTPTSSGTRFRILRPHARGGLGEVFVASDVELGREVALKEIQDPYADDPDSRTRFVLEAEITGGLEHPGIVPVYGLGSYADGRPFYAMRFIRGDSLKDAIERFHKAEGPGRDAGQRALDFRDLLGRFVDVCNAIEYAHKRRVLHRDLKPGNIMLGQYGETLVVDWGLAKPLGQAEPAALSATERPLLPPSGSGSLATQMGSTLGTPAFMSPEQAEGRLDLLGPASDIYSLGATLYNLLTGKQPFEERDVVLLLEKVRRGELVPPRQKNPRVPAPLDAICRKAMALRPEDRYASARALAQDIEHWLADEPVSVYREPLSARLARWGRRHRTQLAAVAGLLITAVVALTISTLLIWREQARTEAQRRQADANFQTALRAVNDMLTEVAQEQLAAEPRMEAKRLALLTQARNYYVQFLDQKSDDPALREATGQAHRRLGDIARLLGKYDEARTAYTQANNLFEELLRERPADADLRRQLAESSTYLGEVERLTSHPRDAAAAYEQAQKLAQALADEFPDRPGYRKELARTCYNLGILYKDTSRPKEAERALDRSIDLLKPLADAHPREPDYTQHLARAYLNLGPVLRAAGRLAAAEQAYQEALRRQQELVRADESNPDYRHELAITYNNLGFLLREAWRRPEAIDSFRRSAEIFERLAVLFPSVPTYRKELANAQNNLAIDLAQGGQQDEAAKTWQQARDLFARLVEEHPGTPDYQGGLAMTLGNLGWLEVQRRHYPEARAYLEDGLKRVTAALAPNPDHPTHRRALSDQHRWLGEALLGLKDHAGAAAEARTLARVLPERGQDRVLAASLLARCVPLARQDAARPEAERAALARLYAEQATAYLQEALAQGALDAAGARDEAFDALRDRADFQALLARLPK